MLVAHPNTLHHLTVPKLEQILSGAVDFGNLQINLLKRMIVAVLLQLVLQ
jgi:hypothetical protein